MSSLTLLLLIIHCLSATEGSVFVDNGVPYDDGPLKVGQLDLSKTGQNSPLHSKVYFPLTAGEYPVVFFIGGWDGLILAEFYEIVLNKLASHGFVVVGVDPHYPALPTISNGRQLPGANLDPYYQQINFTKQYLLNRVPGVARWDRLGLLCHSGGCAPTLQLARESKIDYKASGFLEPWSLAARAPFQHSSPALMYGTELAEEGLTRCSLKGQDYNQFYSIWKCPRIVLEAADFGHCDILDPVAWKACHELHMCKTTNDTRLVQYRQFVQGVAASFFITQLQGRPDAIDYIADTTKVPLKLLEHKSDLNC